MMVLNRSGGFESNFMKVSHNKIHLVISRCILHKNIRAEIKGKSKEKRKKIIKIYWVLQLTEVLITTSSITLCTTVGRKLSSLVSLVKFLFSEQRRNLMKPFNESHFAYCSMIWMVAGLITE